MRHFPMVLAATALCSASLASSGFAAEHGGRKDHIDLDTRATIQYLTEDNTDLGTRSRDREQSLAEQLQLLAGVDFTEDLFGFIHGRALNINGDSGFEDEENGKESTLIDSFLELREFYLKKSDLFGIVPLSLQVGRQRIREDRSLWWNSDNDLIRLNYDSTLLSGFLAAGENLDSYRVGEDNDFDQDEQDRFRVLGEASWQYKYNHYLEGRFVYEDDHSGLEPTGSLVAANDRDDIDQNVVWAGVRSTGYLENTGFPGFLKYRADLIGVAGDEGLLATAPAAGDNRLVTGARNRDVWGWAFDGNVIFDPSERGGLVFTLGYAFGSGDDDPNDDTDNEFRQTDMQGNFSPIGLERQQQKNYGEVLSPELANLHIITAGADYPVTGATDVSATYFNYRLAEDATGLRFSGISAPLTGTDKDIGQALDLTLNVDLDNQFNLGAAWAKDIDFRIRAGSFFAGDAYGAASDETSFRVFSEIKFRF